jgi:hypothetical protein
VLKIYNEKYGEYSDIYVAIPEQKEIFLTYGIIENLSDDAIYEGMLELDTKVRQGLGTVVYNDGSLYHGTWINDKMSGKGFRIFINLDYYLGDYYNGKMVN